MESTDREIRALLRRELDSYAVREPSINCRADAVLRSGEHVIAVDIKVSSRPGVPFGVSDVQHVLDRQIALKRDLRVLLHTDAIRLAVVTNRSLTDRVYSLLTNSGLRVFKFDRDPVIAVAELKRYVAEELRSPNPEAVRPIDQWTLAEVSTVLSAATPEETLRSFASLAQPGKLALAPSLVTATNHILQHFGAEAGPQDVSTLAVYVADWLTQAKRERIRLNEVLDLVQTIERLRKRCDFLDELVRSNSWTPAVEHDALDLLRTQDANVTQLLQQAEAMVENPATISQELVAALVARIQEARMVLEDVARRLQDTSGSESESSKAT